MLTLPMIIRQIKLDFCWRYVANMSKVTGKKADCLSAVCAGDCFVERRRTCLRSDVQQAETVVTASRYDNRPRLSWRRDRQVSNWCIVNHLWLADWCRQWLNINPMCRRFIASSFFLVAADAFCQSFCRFFRCSHCKYIFLREQKWC